MTDSSANSLFQQLAQTWFAFLPEELRTSALMLLLTILAVALGLSILGRLKVSAGLKKLEPEDEGTGSRKPGPIAPPAPTEAKQEPVQKDAPQEISSVIQDVEAISPKPVTPVHEAAPQPHPIAATPEDVAQIRKTDHGSWLNNLKQGLSKTRNQLTSRLTSIFSTQNTFSESVLEEVHEALFRGDIGTATTDFLVQKLRQRFSGSASEAVSWDMVKAELELQIGQILASPQRPIQRPASGPLVILVVGVNGVGKTTSIGKLAAHFLAQDQSVLLCAADTFRAAAIEQLQIWGERLGIDVIKHQAGADPSAVAYDATQAAVSRKMDVLIVDTAGRLHNKKELMDELGKIKRSIGKSLPGAPHETWLVVDATTGQNAVLQTQAFLEVADITGLVVTKLDGTAKGGVVVGICDKFKLPIRYIGVGEKAADLRQFNPQDYAQSLF